MISIQEIEMIFDFEVASKHSSTFIEEISAVENGLKAMAVYSFPSGTNDHNLSEIFDAASNMNLQVIEQTVNVMDFSTKYIFLIRDSNQQWRVSIYLTTRKILLLFGWSDGLEFLESSLLGYSDEAAFEWVSEIKKTRISWSGKTFYLLLEKSYAGSLTQFGNRCLVQPKKNDDIIAFLSKKNRPIKFEAQSFVPSKYIFARAAMTWSNFEKIFGDALSSNEDIIFTEVDAAGVYLINTSLQSNIEIY